MSQADALLAQTVTDLLDRSAPSGGSPEAEQAAAAAQWEALASSGLAWVGVPESAGGSGGSVVDAVTVLRLVGRAGAAVPVAETGLLGGWLLATAGLPLPGGPLAVVPPRAGDDLRVERTAEGARLVGRARRVPWAASAARIVALLPEGHELRVVSVAPERLVTHPGRSLAGEPRDDLVADGVLLGDDELAPVSGVDRDLLAARGAATRVLLIAGAVEGVLALTAAHAGTRRQFGKPLAAFQAIGQHLAVLTEQAALADAAASLATAVLDGSGSYEDAAAAKVVAGDAATTTARLAHQVHGAIGVAREYALQRLTRRLWSWRDEYAGEAAWATRLGGSLATRGGDALWAWVSRSLPDSVV